VGMMNPNHVLNMLDELIEAFKGDRIFKFIHIPVQAGNDEVLKRMNRRYSADDFRRIVKEFRKKIPKMTISTDIICGFPGETDEQFNDSVELIREIKPDVLNISRFWPRPGTAAEKMEGQLHGNITKERSTLLQKVHEEVSFEKNRKWIGWKGKVLIDEKGKPGTNTFIGRNYCYKPVVVKPGRKKINLGDFIEVKIKNVTGHDLRT
jgi:threonylcarbamoyladenosine tRNA methylthiotransferase CDKAL1